MRRDHETTGRGRPGVKPVALAALAMALLGSPLSAQTDYYNLDKHRPLRVEDAYAAERYAFEFQLSPLTLSRAGGVLFYTPSLELKYGILPGMEMSAGIEADIVRADGQTTSGFGDIELSALYNLNSETLGLPAFGIRLTGHIPTHEGESAFLEAKGIVTRVLGGPWRLHLNGAALLGEPEERWWGGAAVDYVLPFRSLLLLAETYYAQPRAAEAEARVHSAAGLRYQLGPLTGIDLGVGTDWAGTERRDWRLTLGVTAATGFRSLMRLR
jgi:hypothetical protein